jgi:hypothetical protein
MSSIPPIRSIPNTAFNPLAQSKIKTRPSPPPKDSFDMRILSQKEKITVSHAISELLIFDQSLYISEKTKPTLDGQAVEAYQKRRLSLQKKVIESFVFPPDKLPIPSMPSMPELPQNASC